LNKLNEVNKKKDGISVCLFCKVNRRITRFLFVFSMQSNVFLTWGFAADFRRIQFWLTFCRSHAFTRSPLVVCLEAPAHVAPQGDVAMRGHPESPQRGGGEAGVGDGEAGSGAPPRPKDAAHRSRRGKALSSGD